MFQEYEKAVNNLTINEENRLKIKVELLERDKISYERLDAKIEALQREMLKNHTVRGTDDQCTCEMRRLTEEEIQQELNQRRRRANLRRESEARLMLQNDKDYQAND
jgi:hypothetical protein